MRPKVRPTLNKTQSTYRYETTNMGAKLQNWVRNYLIENKGGYELNKLVRNDLGMISPGYKMTSYRY